MEFDGYIRENRENESVFLGQRVVHQRPRYDSGAIGKVPDLSYKRYLKEHRKATYTTLLTGGKLNTYLANINEQAQERFEKLIEQMNQAQGITERLKAENALEWTGRMNNIRACAMEIVNKEMIYA